MTRVYGDTLRQDTIALAKEKEMSKKVFLSTSLVLIVALMMSGTAFAASGTTTRQVNRIGTITAETNGSFTLQTISGQLFTVKVSDTTKYERVSGGSSSIRNLDIGQQVTVIGTFDRNHVLTATTVVVMPVQINKGKWIGKRAYGTVLQVIPGSSTFTLETANGRMTFTVDDSTHFTGNSVRNFGALKAGMHAVVGYTMEKDGSLYARGVGAY
jgi:Domain of unknown function (DUF5666)